MKFRSEINRQLGSANTTARFNQAHAVLALLAVLLLAGAISQSVSAGPEPVFPQGLNPEQVAGTIKANAQALKTFGYQQRMQLQLKGETKK